MLLCSGAKLYGRLAVPLNYPYQIKKFPQKSPILLRFGYQSVADRAFVFSDLKNKKEP